METDGRDCGARACWLKSLVLPETSAALRVAVCYAAHALAFVKAWRADAATLELLTIPGFAQSFVRGMRDVKAGRTKPWSKVRADV